MKNEVKGGGGGGRGKGVYATYAAWRKAFRMHPWPAQAKRLLALV